MTDLLGSPQAYELVGMLDWPFQLDDCITWLETRAPEAGFLTGERLSHADVVVGTALWLAREVHPEWLQLDHAPALSAWCARLDALPVFQATYLAVEPPEA